MANKYFKNFILCGEIDYHCLLCKENFQALAEIEKHIRWETHRKAVKSQTRSPKFKKEAIYKIGDTFYCEVCNFTEPDMTGINTHVAGNDHKTNKDKPKTEAEVLNSGCTRDSGYVIVSDIVIENRDWHGIVDKECVVCGTNRLISPAKHMSTTQHVLNLIEARITVEADRYYRKIRNDIFYCFTCKDVVPLSVFENHWSEQKHSEKKNIGIYRATATVSSNASQDKKNELAKKLISTQKDYFDINIERGAAVCKKCKQNLQLDFKAMLSHQKGHKDDADSNPSTPIIVVECPSSSEEEPDDVVYHEVQDHGKRRSELSKYGKENFIKLNPGGSRGYCGLCHSSLSASMRLFKEHVKGSCHKGFLELKGIRKTKDHAVPENKCKPLTEYLTNLFYSRPVRVLWLNMSFCVDIQSFILVSDVEQNPHHKMTKCFACDVYYPQGEDLQHYETEEHKTKFLAAKVLSLKGEFVREIRPDCYLCGFCNKVYPFWELMEKHLQSLKHSHKKNDKDLVLRIAQQWFDEKILTKTSCNPDILYIQFISLGMFNYCN